MENLLKIPCLSEDIELRQDDGKHRLYHRFRNKALILENDVTVDIAKGIDGVNSIDGIVEMMMEKYEVSVSELENDVGELLSILEKEDFIVYLTDD